MKALALLTLSLTFTLGLSPLAARANDSLTRPLQAKPKFQTPLELDTAENAKQRAELKSFLERLEVVRVSMVFTPGNGHQVANLRAMKRLRELGFKGLFQVVYEDNVEMKLKYLISGFNENSRDLQRFLDPELGKVEFIAESNATSLVSQTRAELGISGANDYKNQTEKMNILNVETLLQLQPRRWTLNDAPRSISIQKANVVISLDHLADLSTVTQTQEIKDWPRFLDENMNSREDFRAKKAGLTSLMMQADRLDLLPAYSIDYANAPERVLELVIRSLQKAVQKQPGLFTKPIVIPIFTEPKSSQYQSKMDYKMMELGLSIDSIHDAAKLQALAQARPGSIHIVQVGAIPPAVFDSVFRAATLPVLLEGKNLTSTMLESGKPYLNVTGNIVDIKKELLDRIMDRVSIFKAFEAFDAKRNQIATNVTAGMEALSDYFINAKNPQSDMMKFFASYKANPRSLNQDLLGQSLMEVQHALDTRGLMPPVMGRQALCRSLFR